MKEITMLETKDEVQKALLDILDKLTVNKVKDKNEWDEYWKELNRLQSENQVEISHVNFRGGADPLDEYVEIRNRGMLTVNISAWRVQAGSPDQEYIFPDNLVLLPFQSLRVDTHGNTEHSFNSNTPFWNNRGDLATLMNVQGQVVSSLAYGDSAHKSMLISHIHYDGKEYRTEGDEFVELTNTSADQVDLSGWSLEALSNQTTFAFPESTIVEPYACLKVFTDKATLRANEFSFGSPKAIWNNQAGGCKLLDYQDREVSSYHY